MVLGHFRYDISGSVRWEIVCQEMFESAFIPADVLLLQNCLNVYFIP